MTTRIQIRLRLWLDDAVYVKGLAVYWPEEFVFGEMFGLVKTSSILCELSFSPYSFVSSFLISHGIANAPDVRFIAA